MSSNSGNSIAFEYDDIVVQQTSFMVEIESIKVTTRRTLSANEQEKEGYYFSFLFFFL